VATSPAQSRCRLCRRVPHETPEPSRSLRLDPDQALRGLDWEEVFGLPGPVEVEIGVGKGRFLLAAAAARPEVRLLGVEWSNKYLRVAGMPRHLSAVDAAFGALPTFDPVSTETALRAVADARGVKAATLIHAARVAATGRSVSPGLFEVLALVGRERVHRRLADASRLVSASRA